MKAQPITDPDDPRAADYRDLTDVGLRTRLEPEHGLFMAESHLVIERALDTGYPVRSVLTTPRWLPQVQALLQDRGLDGVPVLVGEEPVVQQITGYRVHRGALAAMQRRPLPAVATVLRGARRLLVLEGIVDHTNVGAVFRSAAGLGFDAALIDPTCADPLYRRAVRVSMGAVFSLPWTRCPTWPESLASLAEHGWRTIALTPHPGATTLRSVAEDPPDRLALILGTEGSGLSAEALASVTDRVRIPMSAAVDSLNVAAAAAVACYALGPSGGSPGPPRPPE